MCQRCCVAAPVPACHACHAKRRWMSPSATPATQSVAASPATKRAQARPSAPKRAQARPSAPPEPAQCHKCHACHGKRSWMSPSATLLETKVDVAKRHTCHAKLGGVTGDQARPSAPPEPPSAKSTTPAMQNEGGCHQVQRLPCEKKVDVAKCLACHAKLGGVAISTTPATQNGCRQVPRLPRNMKVDVTKCHACETKVDVAKCHACCAKLGGVTGDQARPSAPPEPAQCHKCHACHAKRRWMSPSATLVTRDEGGCRQVPRLLRKVGRRHRRPSAPKRATRASPAPRVPRKITKVDVAKCHACVGGCRQVLRLLRKVEPEPAQCHKCHACHAI